MSEGKKLRFITYLSPDIPVTVFETIMGYLGEVTGMDTYLIYESRSSGPQVDKTDPFTLDEVDIGFMESSEYLRLVKGKNVNVELCEAGAVHNHKKNTDRPVYYSDLIISSNNKSKFKELHDLRGHTFGYSSSTSISSCQVVLEHLKKQGFDASFFRDVYESGSQLASIQSVLDGRAEVAAIDSSVLSGFLDAHPNYKNDLTVISSLGPLPIYPIVFNSKLPEKMKQKMTQALLDIGKRGIWCKKLQKLNISGFVSCDSSLYDMESTIQQAVKGMSISKTYY